MVGEVFRVEDARIICDAVNSNGTSKIPDELSELLRDLISAKAKVEDRNSPGAVKPERPSTDRGVVATQQRLVEFAKKHLPALEPAR